MQLQKILTPLDFSDHASHALRWGASLAERYGAQILLLHVIPETVGEMSMHGSAWEQVIMALQAKVETQLFEVARMELKDGLRVDVRVAVGKPAEEIVRVAREDAVDLIVMGTHGHTGSITCCSAVPRRWSSARHPARYSCSSPTREARFNLRMATQHVLSLDPRGVSARERERALQRGLPILFRTMKLRILLSTTLRQGFQGAINTSC